MFWKILLERSSKNYFEIKLNNSGLPQCTFMGVQYSKRLVTKFIFRDSFPCPNEKIKSKSLVKQVFVGFAVFSFCV